MIKDKNNDKPAMEDSTKETSHSSQLQRPTLAKLD